MNTDLWMQILNTRDLHVINKILSRASYGRYIIEMIVVVPSITELTTYIKEHKELEIRVSLCTRHDGWTMYTRISNISNEMISFYYGIDTKTVFSNTMDKSSKYSQESTSALVTGCNHTDIINLYAALGYVYYSNIIHANIADNVDIHIDLGTLSEIIRTRREYKSMCEDGCATHLEEMVQALLLNEIQTIISRPNVLTMHRCADLDMIANTSLSASVLNESIHAWMDDDNLEIKNNIDIITSNLINIVSKDSSII